MLLFLQLVFGLLGFFFLYLQIINQANVKILRKVCEEKILCIINMYADMIYVYSLQEIFFVFFKE